MKTRTKTTRPVPHCVHCPSKIIAQIERERLLNEIERLEYENSKLREKANK